MIFLLVYLDVLPFLFFLSGHAYAYELMNTFGIGKLSATACDRLEYARCQLSGQGTGDECLPLTLWAVCYPLVIICIVLDLRVAFWMFDKDGDGLISVQEVHDTMKSLGHYIELPRVRLMVRHVDMDGTPPPQNSSRNSLQILRKSVRIFTNI